MLYLKAVLEYRFNILRNTNVKITPLYMNSKHNYNKPKVTREIEKLTNQYIFGETTVIYFLDKDDFHTRPADMRFIDEAIKFCAERNYLLVWFVRDIEQVFLGRSIPDNAKKSEAEKFRRQNNIEKVNFEKLTIINPRSDGTSNILCVLDLFDELKL